MDGLLERTRALLGPESHRREEEAGATLTPGAFAATLTAVFSGS